MYGLDCETIPFYITTQEQHQTFQSFSLIF